MIDEGRKLEDDLHARDDDLFRLREELNALKAGILPKKQYHETSIVTVERARAEEDDLKNHLTDLENEIRRINDDRSSLQDQISAAESEIDKNDKDLLAIIDRIKQVQNEIWEQDNLHRELHHQLNEKIRILNGSPLSISSLYSAKKRMLEDEAERGNQQLNLLRDLYEKLVAERNQLNDTDVDSRTAKIERLEDVIKQDVKEMKDLDELRNKLYRDIHETDRKAQISFKELAILQGSKKQIDGDSENLLNLINKHIQRDQSKSS